MDLQCCTIHYIQNNLYEKIDNYDRYISVIDGMIGPES